MNRAHGSSQNEANLPVNGRSEASGLTSRGGGRPRMSRALLKLLGAAALALPAPAQGLIVGASPLPPASSFGGRTQLYFDYYVVDVQAWDWSFELQLDELNTAGCDLYLRKGGLPTLTQYDAKSATPWASNESLRIDAHTNPMLSEGQWYVGVFRPVGGTYNLTIREAPEPSPHPGMGATPYTNGLLGEDGVRFRVWAPNASSVHVAGDFNGWSGSSARMASDGAGHWSLDVRGAMESQRYRYVIRNGTQTLWKNDARASELTSSVGDSVIVDHQSFDWGDVPYSTPGWNDLILYELHIGTFFDSPGGAPGSFQSAISKVPYLADLGVNAVEVMPFSEFAGDFSWGYNYSHPFSVESVYGGVAGLKAFVKECHEHGIAVIGDVLFNHWGPSDLDLWRYDGWAEGNYGGIYFYNSIQSQTAWGDTKPDFGRVEVRQYIRDNTLYWLDELRLDGLRWDSTSTIRIGAWGDNAEGWSLMQWCNDELDASQPWKICIAEDMYNAPNDWITKETGAGGAGFDSQWDAMFVHPVRAAVIAANDSDRNMWAVRDAITQQYNGQATRRVIYTESHDEVANGHSRVAEEIWPGQADSYFSKKRSTLAAAVMFTSPGIPMLFQGQELLEDGYFTDTDPVDWTKLTTFGGIQQCYKDLIRMRRNLNGNTQGLKGDHVNVFHVNDFNKVLAYHRWDQGGPGDDVVVVCNFSNQGWSPGQNYTIGLPRPGNWYVRFNSDSSNYDSSYQNWSTSTVTAVPGGWDGMPYRGTISIGPYTSVVLSQ
jgi:1,4-alpha-glucan branching enzyme